MGYPQVIQGGMGVAVSGWQLAKAVSSKGQLGVVSGTALDVVLARRLQLGDLEGHMRRALDNFPLRDMAERVWEKYFVPGGKSEDASFASKPLASIEPTKALLELTIVSSFVEVFLAKEGHGGVVGINLLEKIQLPTVPALFGAMLAKVDYVLMGAGIPRAIPAILDKLAEFEPAELKIDVAGALPGEVFSNHFDTPAFIPEGMKELKRPNFLAIISSTALALNLAKKVPGVNGFVIEGPTAGGHNAPPRGVMQLDEAGEPIYGPRDVPDLVEIAELGLPFWLAGSYGDPQKVKEAQAMGAQGVQIGTPFAFCNESGMASEIKLQVIQNCLEGKTEVFTDPLASPTGFPFKVLGMANTISEKSDYDDRTRVCDLGYLRSAYRKDDGTLGYRCASEPEADFVKKGGEESETVGRKCVCNGLLATIGLAQKRKDGSVELPLITCGNDVVNLWKYLVPGETSYSAAQVIDYLLGPISNPVLNTASVAGKA